MVAFSVETGSAGRPCAFQPAISASVVSTASGSGGMDMGMLSPPAAVSMKGIHSSFISESRKALVKGPMKEINADATRVSPTSRSRDSFSLAIPSFHRSLLELSALIKRAARLSLSWPLATVASASALFALASLSSLVKIASLSFSSFTWACTAASLVLASSRVCFAAARAMRLGSTDSITSKYTTMLMAQLQRPPAAGFLPAMVSKVKCSRARYCRTSFQLILGTLPASMHPLNSFSSAMNPLTLPSRGGVGE
mmetsp:Transcript_36961/g.99585  ORF Transcript_36961/g.99585 Transcript_36961/m.99585 type:complete len:254 (-) Transcript_36961:57-818(-)